MSLRHLLKNFSHQWIKKSRDKALRSPSTTLRVKEANAAPVSQLRFWNTEYVTVCSRQLYLSSPTELSPTQVLWLLNKLWSNEAMDFTPLYNEQHNLRRLTCIFSWKLHVHTHPGVSMSCNSADPQPTTIVYDIVFPKLPVSIWEKKKNQTSFQSWYVSTNVTEVLNQHQALQFSAVHSFEWH